jgi:hypothetical protein
VGSRCGLYCPHARDSLLAQLAGCTRVSRIIDRYAQLSVLKPRGGDFGPEDLIKTLESDPILALRDGCGLYCPYARDSVLAQFAGCIRMLRIIDRYAPLSELKPRGGDFGPEDLVKTLESDPILPLRDGCGLYCPYARDSVLVQLAGCTRVSRIIDRYAHRWRSLDPCDSIFGQNGRFCRYETSRSRHEAPTLQ